MKEILPPLPYSHRRHYFPFQYRDIVKEVPNEESELFFALVGHQVDVLKVGPADDDMRRPLLGSLTGSQKIALLSHSIFCRCGWKYYSSKRSVSEQWLRRRPFIYTMLFISTSVL
jgi:hypothetical protein